MRGLRTAWYFYRQFGVNAEILIDHAWGIEPVEMADIQHYQAAQHSLSSGQVLSRPYPYDEARLVFAEMSDSLVQKLFSQQLLTNSLTWWTSYDPLSLESGIYTGPLSIDYYGRLHPRHSQATVRLDRACHSAHMIRQALLASFDRVTDHSLLFRRLGISANRVREDDGQVQLSLWVDEKKLARETRLQQVMWHIRCKYSDQPRCLMTGKNLLQAGTELDRRSQIGGHRA